MTAGRWKKSSGCGYNASVNEIPNMICVVRWLGRQEYDEAWQLQNRIAAEVAEGKTPATLILLEHPHTYTIGRSGKSSNLLWSETEMAAKGVRLFHSDRGGDITYHGPGQLVGYPILRLAALQPGGDGNKIYSVSYVRRLEDTLIAALATWGVQAYTLPGLTGVWVGNQPPAKIASIGVRVDVHSVTRHGFALNVDPDTSYWQGIVPCGISGVQMTSLAAQLGGSPPAMEAVVRRTAAAFARLFGFELRIET